MKQRICDICGKDLTLLHEYAHVKAMKHYDADPFNMGIPNKETYDFCPICYEKVRTMIIKERQNA